MLVEAKLNTFHHEYDMRNHIAVEIIFRFYGLKKSSYPFERHHFCFLIRNIGDLVKKGELIFSIVY